MLNSVFKGWRRAWGCACSGFCGVLVLAASGVDAHAAQVVAEFKAEAGQVTAPFVVRDGLLSQPVNTGITNAGRAVYSFNLNEAGFFIVEAWVQAATTNSNSFFVSIDQEPDEIASLWDIPVSAGLTNRIVALRKNTPLVKEASPAVFRLSPGEHKLIFTGCEANTILSRLSILQVTKPRPPSLQLLNVGS